MNTKKVLAFYYDIIDVTEHSRNRRKLSTTVIIHLNKNARITSHLFYSISKEFNQYLLGRKTRYIKNWVYLV